MGDGEFMKDKRTMIKVFNDTDKPLIIRTPPTAHKLEPRKMCAVFIDGNKVFFKIWNDNTIMFRKEGGE